MSTLATTFTPPATLGLSTKPVSILDIGLFWCRLTYSHLAQKVEWVGLILQLFLPGKLQQMGRWREVGFGLS